MDARAVFFIYKVVLIHCDTLGIEHRSHVKLYIRRIDLTIIADMRVYFIFILSLAKIFVMWPAIIVQNGPRQHANFDNIVSNFAWSSTGSVMLICFWGFFSWLRFSVFLTDLNIMIKYSPDNQVSIPSVCVKNANSKYIWNNWRNSVSKADVSPFWRLTVESSKTKLAQCSPTNLPLCYVGMSINDLGIWQPWMEMICCLAHRNNFM